MNKDNLIEFAKDQCEIFPEDSYMGEYLRETLKMLQEEPCEDCVSRQAVDELSRELVHTTRDKADFLCNFWEKLQKLPPVKPAHKKGKWTNGDPICPCCGEDKFKDLDADIWADWQPKYCPNCGAEMGEEE